MVNPFVAAIRTVGTVYCVVVLLTLGFAQQADVDKSRSSPTNSQERLLSALKAIAISEGKLLVFEEEPITDLVEVKELELISGSRMSADSWGKVARILQCHVEGKTSFILFRRSYSNKADVPPVTEKEYAVLFQDIRKILAPFNPNAKGKYPGSSFEPIICKLFDTLTPDQTESARTGDLLVSSLTLKQQYMIRRVTHVFYIQFRFPVVKSPAVWMERIAGKRIGMAHEKDGRKHFGYESNVEPFGKVFNRFDGGDIVSISPTGERRIINPITASDYKDGAAVVPSKTLVINDLINVLNKSNTRAIVSEAAYAEKPIFIVSPVANNKPIEVLNAVADLYGLRVVSNENQDTLTQKRNRLPATMDNVPQAVLNYLPTSLHHAFLDEATPYGLSIKPGDMHSLQNFLRPRQRNTARIKATCRDYLRQWYDNRIKEIKEKEKKSPILLANNEIKTAQDGFITFTYLSVVSSNRLNNPKMVV